jgi:hypothetical protein
MAPTLSEAENHNPVWRLIDEHGNPHDVVACDELQAIRYAERRWGTVIVSAAVLAVSLAAYRELQRQREEGQDKPWPS